MNHPWSASDGTSPPCRTNRSIRKSPGEKLVNENSQHDPDQNDGEGEKVGEEFGIFAHKAKSSAAKQKWTGSVIAPLHGTRPFPLRSNLEMTPKGAYHELPPEGVFRPCPQPMQLSGTPQNRRDPAVPFCWACPSQLRCWPVPAHPSSP